MLKRYRIPLIALLLLLIVVPAAAAERVDDVPPVLEFDAVRFETADLINGELFIVGKGEATSPERQHFVLKTIPFGDEPQETLEVVLYDGVTYVRENNDAQWYIEEDLGDVTSLFHDSGYAVSKIGSTTIAGVATDQYQVWVPGEEDIDHIALDFWIGQQQAYLYQDQISIHGNDPDLGELRLETVTRYFDFDSANIFVGPPANAKVRDSGASFFGDSKLLGRASKILALPAVRDAALARVR
ncbi:MAG TPA: hypothetical protein VGE07_29005 [Herpetosiphonaceae bacterium]